MSATNPYILHATKHENPLRALIFDPAGRNPTQRHNNDNNDEDINPPSTTHIKLLNGASVGVGDEVYWIRDTTSNSDVRDEPWIVREIGRKIYISRDSRPQVVRFVSPIELRSWSGHL